MGVRAQMGKNNSAGEGSTDDELATLDKALFETAHRIAGLAAVAGAVLLSKNHDLSRLRRHDLRQALRCHERGKGAG